MPSKKPRVTLTLEPEVGETVSRLAQLQGCSRAAVLSEIINEVHEPLRRTLLLIEAAQAAPSEVRKGLRDTVEQTQHQLEEQLRQAGLQLADMEESVLHRSQSAGGSKSTGARSPRAHSTGNTGKGKSGVNPRSCNTGVRSQKSSKGKG